MNIQIQHSVVQDMTVLKFNSLQDYFRCLEFMEQAKLQWIPLKYSSVQNTASIRVNEVVLNKISKRFGIGKNESQKQSKNTRKTS